MIALFAASEGEEPGDGEGANSPFALGVAKGLTGEGDLLRVMGVIADEVRRVTAGGQSPELEVTNVEGTPLCLVKCTGFELARATARVDVTAPVCDGSWADASTRGRIALVVAEAAYTGQNLGRLTATAGDARSVTGALRDAGFATRTCQNLDKAGLRTQLEAFYLTVKSAVASWEAAGAKQEAKPVAFFYYSGHGGASRAENANFIIPIDSDVERASQLPDLAVRVSGIIDSLKETGARPIVVIDACRSALKESEGRDGTKGWVAERRRTGTIVAFSTQPGEIAKDRNHYSSALAEGIKRKPGRDVRLIFDDLAISVTRETQGEQQPNLEMSAFGDFQFHP